MFDLIKNLIERLVQLATSLIASVKTLGPVRIFLIVLLSWWGMSAGLAQEPTNFVLTTADTPICDTGEFPGQNTKVWRDIVDNKEGVEGRDPVSFRIGQWPAERFGFKDNWIPLDAYKYTLCGNLDHFNFYDGLGAEADWNNFMAPSDRYNYLIENPKPLYLHKDWHDCGGGMANCMEAEVSPDETYYENPLNSKSSGSSRLEGQMLCTYGPWVREKVHGNRPEIHPSELYWWREAEPSGSFFFTLLQVQDDSNRFDRESDFDFNGDPIPTWWRPWAKFPRTGEFRIAFELNPADPPLRFRIHQDPRDARNVVTKDDPDARQDADDGTEHAIEYNETIVLVTNELQPNDDDIGVRFVNICRTAANTRLQGYLAITSKAGVGDRGGEGYHTLKVEVVDRAPYFDSPPTPILTPPVTPLVSVLGKGLPQSLHRVAFTAGRQLLGDVQVQISGGPAATPDDLVISRVEVVADAVVQTLVFQPDPQGTNGIVKGVPVSNKATLRFVMRSGTVATLPVNGFSIAPEVEAETPLIFEPDFSAWPALVTAAGGLHVLLGPPVDLLRVQQWQIEAAPFYAPLKEGQVSPEDDSPFVEEINEAVITGNVMRMQELFGSGRPFQATWSFRATNLTTGDVVPVRVGGPAAPSLPIARKRPVVPTVQVQLLQGRVPDGSIQVTFPAQPVNDIYELEAIAKITDTNGFTNTVRHRLWSHVLGGEAESLVESLLPAVAELADVSANELVTASTLDNPNPPDDTDSTSRTARMVHLATIDAARDERITLDELRHLIRGAKQLEPVGPTCLGVAATIVGTDGNDALRGTPNDDVIVGLGGKDAINGKGGDDVICGGDGNDAINSGFGNNIVDGGPGKDVLNGGFGDDEINGGNDKDVINGGHGSDTLNGGPGNDVLNGDPGNDTLDGGPGFDKLNGGPGTDTCVNGEVTASC